ncbi:MAG: PHP domain-containing protein [Clostridia bacterium]|nr:PHP domain-containing protein [Clostridia bacterium]
MTPYYYDLHVHSCLSPCADDDMTPNNIAGMAALKGLQLLALTDHNSCKNCPAFFEACRRQGIVPIAGMELSTAEDIHLICLFENLEQAMTFDEVIEHHRMQLPNRPEIFGNQLILDGEDEPIGIEEILLISATDLPIEEAINLARAYGAHVHPAHIDRESNGIVAILGDIPEEYGFSAFELKEAEKLEESLARLPQIRKEAILVSSDAHRLWEINEAEHSIFLEDEPYSSALVRHRFFEYLTDLANY